MNQWIKWKFKELESSEEESLIITKKSKVFIFIFILTVFHFD